MARSPQQLQAWADLLELCEDDCEVFQTSKAMRSAVIEVERELARLHKVEQLALDLAQLITKPSKGSPHERRT